MSSLATAENVLSREFLEVRARILEIAAALDRIDRAEGTVAADPRVQKIRQAISVLHADGPGRAEQVQLIFSIPYDDHWQQNLNVNGRRS